MMWDDHDGMGWWMLWGSMLWIVFLVAFGFLVAWVASRIGRAGPSEPPAVPKRPWTSPGLAMRAVNSAGRSSNSSKRDLS